ncbi:MAG: T9SS type A sorting domain-containing protein [Bacteroidales bacterium]|nr:T9SS type A sorting domain-containing protein [Bacteroidales bacterium]
MWAVGESGITYLNENGSWKLINAQFDQSLVEMSFSDPDHGWIITDANHLLKYRNGVISKESYYPDYNLVDLKFQDSLNGFVLADFKQSGNYFHLLKYVNGSWSDHGVYSTDFPVRMNVLDASHIWVVMSESIMFYDGMSWETQYTGMEVPEKFEDICMLSPTSGFALGNRYMDYSFIYHFDGVSWTRITSGLPGNMYRISAIDEEWIWMIDHWGKIIKYNTITEAWVEELYVHEFWYDTDIQIVSASEGYALSLNGVLRYDGTTWSRDTTMPSVGFTCLDFTLPGFHWLGGEYGAMASTYQDSPLSVEKKPVHSAIKAKVFPNPLSPASVIEYEVDIPADVNIEVFDIQGRKLKSINEGIRHPGKYSVALKPYNLEIGIYTCRIQIGQRNIPLKVVVQ